MSRSIVGRAASTQPTYDFLGGGVDENAGPQPFRQTFRQSQQVKPDAGNEDLRAQVRKLQYEIDSYRQERDLVALRHEKELRDVQAKAESDFKKAQSTEVTKNVTINRYDAVQKEYRELKEQVEAQAKEMDRKLRTAQDQNKSLQEEVDDAQSEVESTTRKYRRQLEEIENKHTALQRTMESLRTDLENKAVALSQRETQLEAKVADVGSLEQVILTLKSQAGDVDELTTVRRELLEQVALNRNLEKTNRDQSGELRHLRSVHKAVEVVEEEKRSLELKVQRIDDLERELGEAQYRKELLEAERGSWSSYLEANEAAAGFDTPEKVIRALVEERAQRASLLEQLGSVRPELTEKDGLIQNLEKELFKAQEELSEARSAKKAPDGRATARLERQKDLATKEVEYLRAQLKAFEAENDTEEAISEEKEQWNKRVQELEDLVTSYRTEVQSLNEKLSLLDREVPEMVVTSPRKRPAASDDGTQSESSTFGSLSRKLRTLQDEHAALQQRHDVGHQELQATRSQLAKLQESTSLRVLSLRANPTADFENYKHSTIDTLRQENKALLAQIQGQPTESKKRGKTVPASSLEAAKLEIQELEVKVKEREKRNARLKEAFGKIGLEWREAIAALLGWKIDFMANNRLKFTSLLYSTGTSQRKPSDTDEGDDSNEDAEDSTILFDREKGTVKISGGLDTQFARDVKGLVKFWVKERREVPGFLAACTMEFYEKSAGAMKR